MLRHEFGWVIVVLMVIFVTAVAEVSLIVDTVDSYRLLAVLDTASLHAGASTIVFYF